MQRTIVLTTVEYLPRRSRLLLPDFVKCPAVECGCVHAEAEARTVATILQRGTDLIERRAGSCQRLCDCLLHDDSRGACGLSDRYAPRAAQARKPVMRSVTHDHDVAIAALRCSQVAKK